MAVCCAAVFTGLFGYFNETLMLFGLVLAHELVHLLTARAQGLEVSEVELFPFGGVAKLEDVLELDPQVESVVSLAGPIFNFILAALALLLYAKYPAWQQHKMLLLFIRSNLTLGFFNLLPALPLDGGRILRARFSGVLGFRQATELAIRISQLLALLLFVLALISSLGDLHLTLLAAAFLFRLEKKNGRHVCYSRFGQKERILYEQGVMPVVSLLSLRDTPMKDILRHFAMKKFHRVLIINKEGRVIGEVMEDEIVETIVKEGLYATIGTALRHK